MKRRQTEELPPSPFAELGSRLFIEGVTPTPVTLAPGMTIGSDPGCTFLVPGLAPKQAEFYRHPKHGSLGIRNLAPEVAKMSSVNEGGVQWNIFPDAWGIGGSNIWIANCLLQFSWVRLAPTVTPAFDAFIGRSEVMQAFYARIEAMAPSAAPVLVTGGSRSLRRQTGESLHGRSGRTGILKPNNAFEFTANAWTMWAGRLAGAHPEAKDEFLGVIVKAEGGTFMLQDAEELDDRVCEQLLRWLDTGQITPLGATRPQPVTARLVALSEDASKAKTALQRQLMQRLSENTLQVPMLKDRPGDLPDLIVAATEGNPEAWMYKWTPAAMALMVTAKFWDDADVLASRVEQFLARRRGRECMEHIEVEQVAKYLGVLTPSPLTADGEELEH